MTAHVRGAGGGESAAHPRCAGGRRATGRRSGRDPGAQPTRRLQAPQGAARGGAGRVPYRRPAPHLSSPGRAPAARSMSGWRRTAGNGRAASMPWSATSRSWKTRKRSPLHERRCPRSADDPQDTDEDGTLTHDGDLSVLRYRRRLAHSQDKVWRALTEDEHVAGWFPTTIEGERVGRGPVALLVPRVRGRAL